jgi:hypothetical protein
MNESTLTQLKIIVERAVRPLRASRTRKRRIREELLAHVTVAFEEEAARSSDEQTALQCTEQRFGNPTDLTNQIQESISNSDYVIGLLENLDWRPDESTLRRAMRYVLVIDVLVLMIQLTAWFLLQGWISQWPKPAVQLIFILTLSTLFSFPFFMHWMWKATYRVAGRLRLRSFLVAVSSWLLVPGLTFWLMLAITEDVDSSFIDLIFPIAVVLWPLGLCGLAMDNMHNRHHQEWASLRIE